MELDKGLNFSSEQPPPDTEQKIFLILIYLPKFFCRDSMSEPYPPELKGSPGFESVNTVYKNALNAESDDNAGNNRQAHASGNIITSLPSFKN